MSIEAVLAVKAREIATEVESSARALNPELREIEKRKREIDAKLDAAHRAVKRSIDFKVRIGSDFQCPGCWVRDKVRSTLTPIPGTKHADIMRCHTCGLDLIIPLD